MWPSYPHWYILLMQKPQYSGSTASILWTLMLQFLVFLYQQEPWRWRYVINGPLSSKKKYLKGLCHPRVAHMSFICSRNTVTLVELTVTKQMEHRCQCTHMPCLLYETLHRPAYKYIFTAILHGSVSFDGPLNMRDLWMVHHQVQYGALDFTDGRYFLAYYIDHIAFCDWI